MAIIFGSLDKKPRVWNIAIISLIEIVLLFVLFSLKPINISLIFISLFIYLVLVIVLFINALIKQLKYNPYSYNTIYYAGFSIFTFVTLSIVAVVYSNMNNTLYTSETVVINLFSALAYSANNYMWLTLPFALIFSIALSVSNIFLMKHEGKSIYNLLGIILSLLIVGGYVFIFANNMYYSGSEFEVMLHDIFINILEAIFLYFESMLIGAIIAHVIVINYKPDYDIDFIIVLGCGLLKDGTPTPLLKARVDTALDFYHRQLENTGKKLKFITSGGQGSDEVISESESMKRYLMSKGINEEDIIKEDKSTSTYENMVYSKKIIDELDGKKILYSTNNFHVFRSGLMAHRVKMRAYGIGSKTKWYFWPNAAVREFVGLLSTHKVKQLIVLTIMIVVYVVLTIFMFKVRL